MLVYHTVLLLVFISSLMFKTQGSSAELYARPGGLVQTIESAIWKAVFMCSVGHKFCIIMINSLAPELFFLILAHSVFKMCIIQEPNKLAL